MLIHLLMGLPVEVWPVSKRTSHHHAMDVIKWIAEVPWLLEIVNFELYIWWLGDRLITLIYPREGPADALLTTLANN